MTGKKFELNVVSEIFEISTRSIRKWLEEGKVEEQYYERVKYPGGYKYLLNPIGAPEPYRSKWVRHISRHDPENTVEIIDQEIYAELKDYQKEHVDLWLNLFHQFGDLKGKSLKNALHIYKEEHSDVSCSYKTFKRKEKEYEQMGLRAISPGWGNREGSSKVTDEDFGLFCTYYLKESRPNVHSCWHLVRGAAFKDGRDVADFPHPKTFMRRLENEYPESAIYMARQGEAAWKKKYANYADRDKSTIAAGTCWVSDHRQLDVFVKDPKTGKLYRPWLTAWMDFKTGKWLSWYLHKEAPNSDHLFMTFKWAVEKYGKPEDIYIDNGKDYRSKDFAGDRYRVGPDWDTLRIFESERVGVSRAAKRLDLVQVDTLSGIPAWASRS